MGAPVGPVIRVVDPLAIAQNRLEGYLQNHRVKVVGDDDDLQVAEVAALISIAQALKVLTQAPQWKPMGEPKDQPGPIQSIPDEHGTPNAHTCYFRQNHGGERWREGADTCPGCAAIHQARGTS